VRRSESGHSPGKYGRRKFRRLAHDGIGCLRLFPVLIDRIEIENGARRTVWACRQLRQAPSHIRAAPHMARKASNFGRRSDSKNSVMRLAILLDGRPPFSRLDVMRKPPGFFCKALNAWTSFELNSRAPPRPNGRRLGFHGHGLVAGYGQPHHDGPVVFFRSLTGLGRSDGVPFRYPSKQAHLIGFPPRC